MQRALLSVSQRLLPVSACCACYSTSSALLQRGGRGQGGERRYDNRQQGYDSRQQGYGNRQQGYDNRQHGYDNRQQQGHDNRRQSYGNQRQGFNNRQQGYDSQRQQGHNNRQRGGQGGRAPQRSAYDFTEKDADTLLQMKKAFKESKSEKDRVLITREARSLLRRVRVDRSSQDERSIMIVLNCAATFKVRRATGVEEAVQWATANLRALSAHNVAIFANALGAIGMEGRSEVFHDALVPVLPTVMRNFTPVEVVMVLQAFGRLRIRGVEEGQVALLQLLEPCIATMPVPHLSTLADVLCRHPLRTTNEEKWREIVQAVLQRALQSVATMHSKEVLTFLNAAAALQFSQEQVAALFTRATATAGFHTEEQVGELFRALAKLREAHPTPSPELTAAAAALQTALVARLEKVGSHVTVMSAGNIWRFAALSKTELPAALHQRICEAVMKALPYKSVRVNGIRRLADAAALSDGPSTELLGVVARYAVNIRPPRPANDNAAEPVDEEPETDESVEELRAASHEAQVARSFSTYVIIRHRLEEGYARRGATPPVELTETLPQELLRHLSDAPPNATVAAVFRILIVPPDCPLRNVANDEAIYAAVMHGLRESPEKFKGCVSPKFLSAVERLALGSEKDDKDFFEAMSGLWSFREPGATTTTTATTPSVGGERDRWLSCRVVTQVLPTGVEHQQDLLRGAVAQPWTTTDTTTVAATSVFPARSAAPCVAADDSQSQAIDDEDAASTAVIMERGASGLSPAVADEGDGDTSAKAMTATAVCRDEAVEAVQRCWWRSLDVDLRPAISLPSAAQDRRAEECVGDETEWDEESVRIAQELLTRVTATAEAATVVSAPRGGDRKTPHIRGVHTTQPLRQVRCSNTTALRKSGFSKPSLSGQQQQQQQQRRLDDEDVSPRSCGQRHDVHLTAAGGHTCFAASAVTRGDGGTGNAAALAPSVFLQRALHPTTAPRSDLTAATTNTTVLSPPPLPLLLRRFFGLWRTYAEERRLQRCTAAYRRYLLDCVRDVLGETTLT